MGAVLILAAYGFIGLVIFGACCGDDDKPPAESSYGEDRKDYYRELDKCNYIYDPDKKRDRQKYLLNNHPGSPGDDCIIL
jgi:hypothetical protein